MEYKNLSPFLQRLHMYFGYWDTGGNPGKLCLWKVSISEMELRALKLRVQIRLDRLSEICGFLAVKGAHNRILTHMLCTSTRSSECCQRQSVHHSPPTPFHNTHQRKKKDESEADQSVARIRKQTFKENEMPSLIGRTTSVPPARSSNRFLRDKQPSATDIGDI